jgi:hypothetical protein
LKVEEMRLSSRRRDGPTYKEGVQTVSRGSSKRHDPNDWILPQNTTIVASIILHAPGLSCVYHYNDDISVFFGAVAGSICEGVFFYLLLAWLLKTYRERVNISKTRSPKTGHLRDFIAHLPIILSIFLLVNALLVFPMGDFYFQSKADGVVADFQVVASAFHQAGTMLTWVGGGHSDYILQYVLVSCAAFGFAFLTFGYGVHRRCREVRCWNANKKNVIKAGILASIVYAVGAWSPVLHCSLCAAAVIAIELVGTDQQQLSSKLANVKLSRDILQEAQKAPNVVLLIHDSLSGSVMMNTNEVSACSFLSSVFDLFIRLIGFSLSLREERQHLSFIPCLTTRICTSFAMPEVYLVRRRMDGQPLQPDVCPLQKKEEKLYQKVGLGPSSKGEVGTHPHSPLGSTMTKMPQRPWFTTICNPWMYSSIQLLQVMNW